jgi:RNA polymerase sigma factor (sigma-70 family)
MDINSIDFLDTTNLLIQNCIAGDRNAQNKLYDLFAPKMFGVCMRYSKNREEAEDILQEGFIQVFKSLATFKFAGSFEGWIRKIILYAAIAHYKTQSKMHAVVDIECLSNANDMNNDDIISHLGKKELLKMVQALPPKYRMIFNLYVFEGLKHREIANVLGISEGTSKSNFFDAKVILQRAVINCMKVAQQNLNNG